MVPHTPLTVRPTSSAPLVVNIEGNIGVGKSTVLRSLKEYYADDESVRFVDEPVAAWEKAGLLKAMYSGQISLIAFQQMALSTRYADLLAALLTPNVQVVICERSIWSDQAIFADVNISDEYERSAYNISHSALCAALPEVHRASILLDAPIETLISRVQARNREGESDGGGLTVEYLEKLQHAHRLYFDSVQETKRQVLATGTPGQVLNSVCKVISDMRFSPGHSPTSVMDIGA